MGVCTHRLSTVAVRHRDCIHRADIGTTAALRTGVVIDFRNIVGRYNRVRVAESTDPQQDVAAAAAAMAYKRDVLLDVIGAEHQTHFAGASDVLKHLFP